MSGLSFIIGFIIGTLFGVIIMCCFQIDKDNIELDKYKKK